MPSASDYFLPVIAIFDDGAALANGVARAAKRATMTDEVDMKGIEFSLRHDAIHDLVRSRVRAFLRNQTDAS